MGCVDGPHPEPVSLYPDAHNRGIDWSQSRFTTQRKSGQWLDTQTDMEYANDDVLDMEIIKRLAPYILGPTRPCISCSVLSCYIVYAEQKPRRCIPRKTRPEKRARKLSPCLLGSPLALFLLGQGSSNVSLLMEREWLVEANAHSWRKGVALQLIKTLCFHSCLCTYARLPVSACA